MLDLIELILKIFESEPEKLEDLKELPEEVQESIRKSLSNVKNETQ